MNSFDKKVLDEVARNYVNVSGKKVFKNWKGFIQFSKMVSPCEVAKTSRQEAVRIVEEIQEKHINDTIESGDPCNCIIEGEPPCEILDALFEIKKRLGGDGK